MEALTLERRLLEFTAGLKLAYAALLLLAVLLTAELTGLAVSADMVLSLAVKSYR